MMALAANKAIADRNRPIFSMRPAFQESPGALGYGYGNQIGNLNQYQPTLTIGNAAPAISFQGSQLSSLTSGVTSSKM